MREETLSLRRRIAFVACYLSVALFVLLPTRAYGNCMSGTCSNPGCSCVGQCMEICEYTNERVYCVECFFDVAQVVQNYIYDGGSENCIYICCQTSFTWCP